MGGSPGFNKIVRELVVPCEGACDILIIDASVVIHNLHNEQGYHELVERVFFLGGQTDGVGDDADRIFEEYADVLLDRFQTIIRDTGTQQTYIVFEEEKTVRGIT